MKTHPHADTFFRRRGAILALVLLVLGFAAAPSRAASSAEEPASSASQGGLSAAETVFDFGTLVKGAKAAHTFVLHNAGKEPVTIERAEPSCGCTVADFDKTIPPGGDGEVRTQLNTAEINGMGSSAIGIFTTGKAGAALVLHLKYNVVPKLLAFPGYARWIYVQHEKQGTISQTIYSNDGADFDVVSVDSPMSAIKVSFRKATKAERKEGFAGSQWHLDATLEPDAPVGAITGYLVVHTTHPLQADLRIPVSGFVRPALFVSPQEGDYGTLHLDKPREATFHIRNFATDPIALTEARTSVPGVTAKIEPVQEGRRYRVVLRFDPKVMKPGPFAGELRITTDSEKVPSLTVHLSGTLSPPKSADSQ